MRTKESLSALEMWLEVLLSTQHIVGAYESVGRLAVITIYTLRHRLPRA